MKLSPEASKKRTRSVGCLVMGINGACTKGKCRNLTPARESGHLQTIQAGVDRQDDAGAGAGSRTTVQVLQKYIQLPLLAENHTDLSPFFGLIF